MRYVSINNEVITGLLGIKNYTTLTTQCPIHLSWKQPMLKWCGRSQYVLGHAAMIESGRLKQNNHIDNVIVVAGPQGSASPEKESELYSCYYNSLVLAYSQKKASIAFPSISTGIFGFPKDRAAAISLKAVHDFINQYPSTTLKTISIHFLPSDPLSELEIYQAAAAI